MTEPGRNPRVLILGAGFGGLELSSALSEEMGDDLSITLIDKSDSFVFGFSKLEVMFGRSSAAAVRMPYAGIIKPGVRFSRETITAIDPVARRVTTDAGTHEADIMVIALGAGALAVPLVCLAQPKGKVWRIGSACEPRRT